MTSPVTVLIRVLRGCCGPVAPEDGIVLRLPAEVAAELVHRGDAAPVTDADTPATQHPTLEPDSERTS